MNEIRDQLLAALIPVLATAVTGILALLAKRLDSWLKSKLDNENHERIARRLNMVVFDVVTEIQQTQVDALLKAASPDSPGGRKITKEEAAELREMAVTNVKSYLGEKGIEELKRVLDLDDGTLHDYITTTVESAVRANKHGAAVLR